MVSRDLEKSTKPGREVNTSYELLCASYYSIYNLIYSANSLYKIILPLLYVKLNLIKAK